MTQLIASIALVLVAMVGLSTWRATASQPADSLDKAVGFFLIVLLLAGILRLLVLAYS